MNQTLDCSLKDGFSLRNILELPGEKLIFTMLEVT